MKILVFDIQRYSIHDGPGIRTTVFLKGCNLQCAWCENPESIAPSPQLAYHAARCMQCLNCEAACPSEAIKIGSGYPINPVKCNLCGRCVAICPTGALYPIGQWRDVEDLVNELLRDQDYWSNSGGGVTISGGEASLQADALRALLIALHAKGVHTVLQTNGNLPWEKLEPIIPYVDLLHFDLKGIDNSTHRQNTRAGNERILENARRLSLGDYPVVFRVPLVPGYNDSPEDLLRLRNFLVAIKARAVDVIPYHNLGERKRQWIGAKEGELSVLPLSQAAAVNQARRLVNEHSIVTFSGEELFPLPKNLVTQRVDILLIPKAIPSSDR